MKAKVIATGEILEVTKNPTWYREKGQGPDRREFSEDELEFIYPNKKVEEFDMGKALSDLDRKIKDFVTTDEFEKESETSGHCWAIAKYAFLLGLKAQKGE